MLYTWLSSALFFAGTWLTVIFRRRSRNRSTRTRKSRSLAKIFASIRAEGASKPIISRSVLARGDLPQERYPSASSKLVLPWAFSPKMTLHRGSKSADWFP